MGCMTHAISNPDDVPWDCRCADQQFIGALVSQLHAELSIHMQPALQPLPAQPEPLPGAPKDVQHWLTCLQRLQHGVVQLASAGQAPARSAAVMPLAAVNGIRPSVQTERVGLPAMLQAAVSPGASTKALDALQLACKVFMDSGLADDAWESAMQPAAEAACQQVILLSSCGPALHRRLDI